jgi:5-methylcytosine-specific restriction endonuclease McrA
LSLDCFQKSVGAPDGLQYRCRECGTIVSRECRARRGHLWLEKTSPWDKRPENRDRKNAATRSRRAKNPDKIRKENRSFRERNPFSVASCVANGRAKLLGIDGVITTEDWRDVVQNKNFICHICGRVISLEIGSPDRLSLDHIIPLSRGGKNTKDNIAPAHRRCNQGRTNMTLEEFDSWLGQVFKFRGKENGEEA